ncbi:27778_t:CDS:1, partial [Dentiscutata erythropus]
NYATSLSATINKTYMLGGFSFRSIDVDNRAFSSAISASLTRVVVINVRS